MEGKEEAKKLEPGTTTEDGLIVGPDGEARSKKAHKKYLAKLEKDKKKAEHKAKAAADREAKAAEEKPQEAEKEGEDYAKDKYGDTPLIVSAKPFEETSSLVYTALKDLSASQENQEVRIRSRLHNSRGKGGNCFIVLRDDIFTAQAIMFKSETISSQMVKFASHIPKESVIEIVGIVKKTPTPVKGCTVTEVEIEITEIWNTHKAVPRLPFNLEDAGRRCENQSEEDGEDKGEEDEPAEEGKKQEIRVN